MAQIFFGVFSSLISASIDLTAFVSMKVLYNYVNFSYILFIHLSIWVGDGVVLHFLIFLFTINMKHGLWSILSRC